MSKFNYTFRIDLNNGNGLQALPIKPYSGFSTYHKLGEELDSGFLTLILKNKTSLPMFSYLEIEISENGTENKILRKFYTGRDEVEVFSKNRKYYKHSIEIIELTKKMEKIVCETITFTQPLDPNSYNYTLADCIQRIIRIFPLGTDDRSITQRPVGYINYPIPEGRKFKYIDMKLQLYLDTIPAPEFVFNNMTFREIVSGILKYVNATARAEDRDTVGAEFYGQLKSLLKGNIEDSYYYSTEQNVEEASSSLESFAQNVVQEKREENATIIYPSKSSWDYLKSDFNNYSVNDNNFGILLNNRIKVVNNIIFKDILFAFVTNESFIFRDVSLKNRIIEKEVFDTLSYSEQKNYIYYSKNSNFINLSNTYKNVIFTYYSLSGAVLYSALDEFNKQDFIDELISTGLNINETFRVNIWLSADVQASTGAVLGLIEGKYVNNIFNIEYFESKEGIKDSSHWSKIKFRIEYTPFYTSRLLSQKQNVNDINVDTQSLMQQQEHIVSFKNYSNTIFSNAQRNGTMQLEATFKHFSLNDLLNLGDYNKDGYVCINSEFIYYNDVIVGKYLFSKDYNRISSFIGINSEVRQFEIPSDNQTYERQCKWEDFLEVGYSYKLDTNQNFIGRYGTFKQYINNTLGQSIGDVEYITSCLIYYNELYDENKNIINILKNVSSLSGSEYQKPAILLECASKGSGNVLSFDFGFNDNVKAGNFRYKQDEIIDFFDKYLMQPVPYCQNEGRKIGFLRNISYSLSSDLTTESQTLPLLDRSEGLISFSEKIKNEDVMVLKDSAEILRFTHIISCLSIDDNIVLGRAFTEKNASITNVKDEIYVYISPNEYSKFDIIKMKDKNECYKLGLSKEVGDFNLTPEESEMPGNVCSYTFKNTISFTDHIEEPKTIIFANSKNEILMTIKYDPEKIYKTIYFNFRHTRSNIVYDY